MILRISNLSRYKSTLISSVFIIFLALLASNLSAADILNATILQTFKKHNTKFLCLSTPSSLPIIRKNVETHISLMGINSPVSANDAAKATYTAFPCPFSPYRDELRKATEKDIAGNWLFPEASQKLRYGPKSPLWSKHAVLPIKCEFVAYYSSGETRNALFTGKKICPFIDIKDADGFRSNPIVSTWKILSPGIVKISRSDVSGHLEEWEIFSVIEPFTLSKVLFKKGDLLAYLRKQKGNNYYVATMFRHLQRLP